MCGASKNGSQEEAQKRELSDKYYIPAPFPKDLFEPLEWSHILAMLDVCTNEAISTQFCDNKGYDLESMNTIIFALMEEEDEITP